MDMDITATLTPGEILLCSRAERACGLVGQALEEERASAGTADVGRVGSGDVFLESLRLKNTLDAFEEKARIQPSWDILSVLVNCEYRLYLVNQHTPLRNNPFLSHWVETIQRLDQQLSAASTKKNATGKNGPDIVDSDVWTARLGLIKALLQSSNATQFAHKSPKQLHADFVKLSQPESFDLRPYIRMLEEEDIYERTPSPPDANIQATVPSIDPQSTTMNNASLSPHPSKLTEFQQWKQDVLSLLETDSAEAIPQLTHLPIELTSLDFLTTLLQDCTLQSHNIDPAPVISDYIQHALRLTEQMGQPPPPPASSSSQDTSSLYQHDSSVGGVVIEDLMHHGREAQTRAVKLLLLFIRNVIRKALVPLEAIYFEIQEICVRYVWIREVREFRAFIEEGEEGAESREGGGGG